MMHFTVEEENLICIWRGGLLRGLIQEYTFHFYDGTFSAPPFLSNFIVLINAHRRKCANYFFSVLFHRCFAAVLPRRVHRQRFHFPFYQG